MDPVHILFVSGKSGSGKTTFIEKLLPALVKRGITACVVKDIHLEGFCIDQEGKDTWRHWKAGASIVVARGPGETDILVKRCMALEELLPAVEDADLIVAEGFKELHGRKVIVARDAAGLAEMEALLTGDDVVWGIAGPVLEGNQYSGTYPPLSDEASIEALVNRLEPLAKQHRLARNRLAMPMAAAGCTLSIDGTPIEMKQFVAETLKNVVIGAIASLNWNVKVPISRVDVSLGKGEGGEGWAVGAELNGNPVGLKDFVQHSIAGAVLGYVSTLKLPGDATVTRAREVLVTIE
ncbi:MAG: molybdopterin-guanine dinucleotide biosynthesis protein B [Candidatus Lokiarchaeota archaeon]|nr:molybdopterin-guanine dinucleotide biosynthesis protein B [Candidatus Lokiarchaeota archaeon]